MRARSGAVGCDNAPILQCERHETRPVRARTHAIHVRASGGIQSVGERRRADARRRAARRHRVARRAARRAPSLHADERDRGAPLDDRHALSGRNGRSRHRDQRRRRSQLPDDVAPRRTGRRGRDDDAQLHAGARPRARVRRRRDAVAARPARGPLADRPRRAGSAGDAADEADRDLQPEQSNWRALRRRGPESHRGDRGSSRRVDSVGRDLSRRRTRRPRDAVDVGPRRARRRDERPVEGVRAARPAHRVDRRPSSRRRGRATTTRRSRRVR